MRVGVRDGVREIRVFVGGGVIDAFTNVWEGIIEEVVIAEMIGVGVEDGEIVASPNSNWLGSTDGVSAEIAILGSLIGLSSKYIAIL